MPKEKFENSLKRLEKIVDSLESGNLPLEETLKLYEEGVKLSRICSKTLHEAERKIEVLSKNRSGDFDLISFEEEESDEEPKAKKKKGTRKTK